MGDHSFHIDTFDSLDYLIPPVKKSPGPLETDILFRRDFKRQTDIRLIKNFRNTITRSEKWIQESFVNSNNKNCNTFRYSPDITPERRKNYLIEDKPMIKVTVIPKVAETQTSKVFNKRREKTIKLQSTVSNQESSIKSQNIFFMIKGKRRERVYEIKSTESSNLSNKFLNARYEDISIQQITNSKRLINSLNMERKKPTNRKTEPINHKMKNFGGTCQNIKNYQESEGVNARKSKITIVGQLGLTRDDQYVLNCAATVNEKPIATNYVQLDHTTDRNLLNINRNAKASLQDSNDQTDILCYANNCTYLGSNRKEQRNSQATQVNFDPPQNQLPKDFHNKVIQCNCGISTTENNAFNVVVQENVLKECKSPLVVISVYPRHDKEDNNNCPVKMIQQPTSSQKIANYTDFTKLKARKRQQRNNNAVSVNISEQRSLRSKSPSPAIKTVPNKTLIDKTVNQVLRKRNNTDNVSPQRVQANRKKISENKSKQKINKSKKDVSYYCPSSKGLENVEFRKLGLDDAKETDTKQVKRALVNNFLRSVGSIDQNNAKMKLLAPKVDTSRVTININGDRERYDVVLEQTNFDTGVSVRKTLNKQSQIRGTADEVDKNSMENFLMLSEENKKAPRTSRETRVISKTAPKETGLKIRDSLEICHSREGRNGSRLIPTQMRRKDDLRYSFFNSDFSAPIKHYRGDDCSIPDPNERDKEIRELLGIARNTRNSKKVEHVATKEVFYSHHENERRKTSRCCKKRSSKELMTAISISKLAKQCLRRTKIKNQVKSKVSKTQFKNTANKNMEERGIQAFQIRKKVFEVSPETSDTLPEELSTHDEGRCLPDKQGNDKFTKYKDVTADVLHKQSFIQQNLKLNGDVQVFLEIEQFNEQKPITLTRKQYDKVKRTIQYTINQRKCCKFNNLNIVSVGEIKIKPKLRQNCCDREIQTELFEIQRNVRCVQIQTQHNINYKRQKTKKHTHNIKQNESNQKQVDKKVSIANTMNDKNINKDVIEKHVKPNEGIARQTVSSVEIRYANVARMKNITISSTHFGDGLHNQINTHENKIAKPNNSLHTIFKGHRKSATPNLGTSAYSLCSDANDSTKSIRAPPYAGDAKPKKPFLRRLLSCLVLRSTETTVLKATMLEKKMPNMNSSVDSYHISSSLGALEMTSTLYDTSASFYSNHTIGPMTKMKRGFLNSVRGFLTTRKS